MPSKFSLPIVSFETARDWEQWLARNHTRSGGAWLRIFKKESGRATVNYAEALDEALCVGWIDSQKRGYDKLSFLQKFGPRKAGSGWSKLNTGHAERLRKAGKMKPAGLKEIQAAKRDGRWQRAYDSPATATAPADFLRRLAKNEKAKAFFREARKAQYLCDRLSAADREEARDAHGANPRYHRDAGQG
jgi:uncharacterized protein YdeI (YjbR/CyaY-like superfamily)